MNWRNPRKILPEDGQIVCVMLEPHKNRGTLKGSAMSIQIVCGEVEYNTGEGAPRVNNYDELGMGNVCWTFQKDPHPYEERIIAWIPVEEMVFPKW